MNFEELVSKDICLIVTNPLNENSTRVYLGILQFDDSEYFFLNAEKGWRVSLNKDLLDRIWPVPEDLKETLLNSEYAFSMNIGDMPSTDFDDFNYTGITWREGK
jgi:hypothetical protein